MAEKKELLKYEESIFKRIIKWFKSLFHKPGKRQVINKKEKMSETELNDEAKGNTIEDAVDKATIQKESFFELYNDIKDGKVDIDTLSNEEIERFNRIIGEEISLKYDKLEKLKKENEDIEVDIKNKEKELEDLKAQIGAKQTNAV